MFEVALHRASGGCSFRSRSMCPVFSMVRSRERAHTAHELPKSVQPVSSRDAHCNCAIKKLIPVRLKKEERTMSKGSGGGKGGGGGSSGGGKGGGGGSGGGGGKGGGGSTGGGRPAPPNGPSTTGNPSGGGRGNNPPR